jgi:hypothetical protein
MSGKNSSKRLLRALRPGVAALREFSPNGDWMSLEPLAEAFVGLGLDPKKRHDWQILAAVLAIHLINGRSGRPSEWTVERQLKLLQGVHHRKSGNPHLSDAEVCRVIARDHKSPTYFRASGKGEGLRKQLRRARLEFSKNSLARLAFPLAF